MHCPGFRIETPEILIRGFINIWSRLTDSHEPRGEGEEPGQYSFLYGQLQGLGVKIQVCRGDETDSDERKAEDAERRRLVRATIGEAVRKDPDEAAQTKI